jgi:hypothetical protein
MRMKRRRSIGRRIEMRIRYDPASDVLLALIRDVFPLALA